MGTVCETERANGNQWHVPSRGLPTVCLEARHVHVAMSAQRNKTDATDALALAHIVRTGWFRQAHIKTESCYGCGFC